MSIENVQVKDGSRRLWAICRAAERAEIARVLEENRLRLGQRQWALCHALIELHLPGLEAAVT